MPKFLLYSQDNMPVAVTQFFGTLLEALLPLVVEHRMRPASTSTFELLPTDFCFLSASRLLYFLLLSTLILMALPSLLST